MYQGRFRPVKKTDRRRIGRYWFGLSSLTTTWQIAGETAGLSCSSGEALVVRVLGRGDGGRSLWPWGLVVAKNAAWIGTTVRG